MELPKTMWKGWNLSRIFLKLAIFLRCSVKLVWDTVVSYFISKILTNLLNDIILISFWYDALKKSYNKRIKWKLLSDKDSNLPRVLSL